MVILLIEDNKGDILLIREMLLESQKEIFKVLSAEKISAAIKMIRKEKIDIILVDLNLPDSCGLDSFNKIAGVAGEIPIIVMTGLNDEEIALETMRHGAQDYIVKGQLNSQLIIRALRYAIERKRLEKDREDLIVKLKDALAKINTLRGLLPICSYCKKIRNDQGYWQQIEEFVRNHVDVNFSHSICPECAQTHYPDLCKDINDRLE